MQIRPPPLSIFLWAGTWLLLLIGSKWPWYLLLVSDVFYATVAMVTFFLFAALVVSLFDLGTLLGFFFFIESVLEWLRKRK